MSDGSLRRFLGALLLALMAGSAVYGGDFFGVRERFLPPATRTEADPFQAVTTGPSSTALAGGRRRSRPYWLPSRRFAGTGPLTTDSFAIDSRALQWRAAWRCERGRFRMQPKRPGGEDFGHSLADTSACPRSGQGVSVAPGQFKLGIQAEGAWEATVEPQRDVPLVEPPTPMMASDHARLVASGEFYDIDEDGDGGVRIYRQRDGSALLRLDDFYVTPNVDLEIRFSELETRAPRRSLALPSRTSCF